jgi:transcriptional regulator with XRE-family HTH domain
MRLKSANGDCETAELQGISGAITAKQAFAGAEWCCSWACAILGDHSVAMGREPKGQEESDKATDDIIKIVSRRLADTRKKRGLTQTDLGTRAGVKQSYIFELEEGSSSMTLRTLIRMARALEVDPRDLFPGGPLAPVTAAELQFLVSAIDRLTKAVEERTAYEKLRDRNEESLLVELKPLVDLRNALAVRNLAEEAAEEAGPVDLKPRRRKVTKDT